MTTRKKLNKTSKNGPRIKKRRPGKVKGLVQDSEVILDDSQRYLGEH
jgi:hypothetical protein